MNHKIDRDTYIIPPNFIESGTFFGGMFKARNVIEAGILAFAIGVPVFSLLPLGLTARIIALCLTALPAALVALIGISGESLSSFLLIFIKYLRNRRIVGGNSAEDLFLCILLENQPHQAANQGTDTPGRDQPPSGYRSEGDGTGDQ